MSESKHYFAKFASLLAAMSQSGHCDAGAAMDGAGIEELRDTVHSFPLDLHPRKTAEHRRSQPFDLAAWLLRTIPRLP